MSEPNLSSFLWSVADLLRGDYKPAEYGKVILPFTVRRIFASVEVGYRTITAERPERDEKRQAVQATKGKQKGKPVPDANLRDTENLPLAEDVQAYFRREVLPHAPDAWIDDEKTKVGYEIPCNRHFYVWKPPRPLAQIGADLKVVTDRIVPMIQGLSK